MITFSDCYTPMRIEDESAEKSALLNALLFYSIQVNPYEPYRILRNGPCTIVFWKDGTKTVVKRSEEDADDDYSAFTAALAKKVYGSTSAVKRIVERTERQKEKKAQNENKENPVGGEFGKMLARELLTALEKLTGEAQKGE